jgi:hypothetical protein
MADNDARAIEDLRREMGKLVVGRYKLTEGACSGSLSPSKVAQIMGASTASLENVPAKQAVHVEQPTTE